MGRGQVRRPPDAARAVYAAALEPLLAYSDPILLLTRMPFNAQMRASPACRRRSAASTAIASCAGARLPLEPRHASIRNHHVLIVSLCLVRRGLALIIESDFYATDAGRQHFADQLTSIR